MQVKAGGEAGLDEVLQAAGTNAFKRVASRLQYYSEDAAERERLEARVAQIHKERNGGRARAKVPSPAGRPAEEAIQVRAFLALRMQRPL